MTAPKCSIYADDLQTFVAAARAGCGCKTCAPRDVPKTMYEVEDARLLPPQPTSCMAPTILAHMLSIAPVVEIVELDS